MDGAEGMEKRRTGKFGCRGSQHYVLLSTRPAIGAVFGACGAVNAKIGEAEIADKKRQLTVGKTWHSRCGS